MITRKCRTCGQQVAPEPHCPKTNKYCDWWRCPLCKSQHCHGRTIPRKEPKK